MFLTGLRSMRLGAEFTIICIIAFTLISCGPTPPLPRGLGWDQHTGAFSRPLGEGPLPPGFTYQVDQGTDTTQGHFISSDGRVIVQHDIGGYEGARVWIAKREWPQGAGVKTTLAAVTFPDTGCANFFTSPADA